MKTLSAQDVQAWQSWCEGKWKIIQVSSRPRPCLQTKLDLHGFSVQQAYIQVYEFFTAHKQIKTREVVIVTGKSGQIANEFPNWIANCKMIKSYQPIVDARGGIGSYCIALRY